MKNLYKYNLAIAMTALLAFSSCLDDDQDYPAADKTTATAVATNTTIQEGESATLTITTDRPIDTPTDFKIELISGSADLSDFEISAPTLDEYEIGPAGYQATIPATQTSVTVDFTGTVDILPEGSESATFRVTQGQLGSAIVSGGSYDFTVTLDNQETTDFTFRMEWDTEYIGTDGDPHSLCDFDFDIEVYTATFAGPIATSYSSCPEEVNFSMGDLADGDYWLVPSYWNTGGAVPVASDFDVPVTLTFAKDGVWLEEVEVNDYWNTGQVGASGGNGGAYLVRYILTVAGDTYTVTDADTNAVIGTGKSAQTGTKKLPTNFVGGRQ